jgi:hypothetical protein
MGTRGEFDVHLRANFLPCLHAAELRRQAAGSHICETFGECRVDPRMAIDHLLWSEHDSTPLLLDLELVALAEAKPLANRKAE